MVAPCGTGRKHLQKDHTSKFILGGFSVCSDCCCCRSVCTETPKPQGRSKPCPVPKAEQSEGNGILTPCLFPCSILLLQRSTSGRWCGTPREALSFPPTPSCPLGSSRARPTSTAASSTPTTWPRGWVSAREGTEPVSLAVPGCHSLLRLSSV